MQTITFTCETITPMFLAGADGTTPELRAPSIKGALRFWWRAMNSNNPNLKKDEGLLWGDTKLRSNVSIEVHHEEWNTNDIIDYKQYATNDNLKYLLFSIALKDRDIEIDADKKKAITDKKFAITFRSKDEECLKQVIATFWLLTFLSGIGSRSRRGFGSFSVSNIDRKGQGLLDKWEIYFSRQKEWEADEFILKGFEKCKELLSPIEENECNEKISSLLNSRIVISEDAASLSNIGKNFREFRSTRTKDHNLILKTAFGIPLKSEMPTQRPKSDHTEVYVNDEINRRASPIIISLFKYENKTYWIVTKMSGIFLDKEVSLKYQQSGNNCIHPQNIETDILDEFINELANDNITIK